MCKSLRLKIRDIASDRQRIAARMTTEIVAGIE
jgi:hypothetical protein